MPKNHFGLCGCIYLFWGKGWFESYLMTCLWMTYISGRIGQSGTQLWFCKTSLNSGFLVCLIWGGFGEGGVIYFFLIFFLIIIIFVFQSQDHSWILSEFQNPGLKQLNEWLLYWFDIQYLKSVISYLSYCQYRSLLQLLFVLQKYKFTDISAVRR